jgi:hypothetical protein
MSESTLYQRIGGEIAIHAADAQICPPKGSGLNSAPNRLLLNILLLFA